MTTETANKTTLELKGDREFVIARTFNAPARIVFEAWTKPEFVKRWWAPKSRNVELVSCESELRVGGYYRYVLEKNGKQFLFSGNYMEITPPARLVHTEMFDPTGTSGIPVLGQEQGPAVVVTVTFEDRPDGKTNMVSHSMCPSKELRDMIMASGMESGMRETMDQLDELVATLS